MSPKAIGLIVRGTLLTFGMPALLWWLVNGLRLGVSITYLQAFVTWVLLYALLEAAIQDGTQRAGR